MESNFHMYKNKMSVGDLLFTFFHYYTRIFDWKEEAISMRLAEPYTKGDRGTNADGTRTLWDRKKVSCLVVWC